MILTSRKDLRGSKNLRDSVYFRAGGACGVGRIEGLKDLRIKGWREVNRSNGRVR